MLTKAITMQKDINKLIAARLSFEVANYWDNLQMVWCPWHIIVIVPTKEMISNAQWLAIRGVEKSNSARISVRETNRPQEALHAT